MSLLQTVRLLQSRAVVQYLGNDEWRITFRSCEMFPAGVSLWGTYGQLMKALSLWVELSSRGWCPRSL